MYDAPSAIEELKTAKEASDSGESGSDKGCIEAF